MTVVNNYYLTPALDTQMQILSEDGFTLLTKWSSFSLWILRSFWKKRLEAPIMQFCPFSILSSFIDRNGFASLTTHIAQGFNNSHLFTQSLSLHITPAIIISMCYPIYLISTGAVISLITDVKKLFYSNHITSLLKIKWAIFFFSPKSGLWQLC